MESNEIKEIVKKKYGEIAVNNSSCCCSCSCDEDSKQSAAKTSQNIGYSKDDIDEVPEGSNLGLGCGNPVALSSIKEGDVVLDLGSGAGFDCFLVAKKVGANGKVIGVDMTEEMLEKARENAVKGNYNNVEFRMGEMENLPVEDNSIDKIISNCVINLSPDKEQSFKEAYRVLKNGGKIYVSDIVLTEELPSEIKNSMEHYAGCVAGAMLMDDYLKTIEKTGFKKIEILEEKTFPATAIKEAGQCSCHSKALDCIKSINVTATK
ncbi:MAG: arsenite methyltransferase [Candidatus Eremiobacteraeota bacterium]|nr:arsenite methyltransferase [Candidatus Eremiobacteraeota bacterium]